MFIVITVLSIIQAEQNLQSFWFGRNQCAAHSCYFVCQLYQKKVNVGELDFAFPQNGEAKSLQSVISFLKRKRIQAKIVTDVKSRLARGHLSPLLIVTRKADEAGATFPIWLYLFGGTKLVQ